MKFLQALIVLLFMAAPSVSAQYIFVEEFDAGIPNDWVNVDNDGIFIAGGHLTPDLFPNSISEWTAYGDGDDVANGEGIVSTSWLASADPADDLIGSPVISIPDTGYKLEVVIGTRQATYADGFKIYVSTEGNSYDQLTGGDLVFSVVETSGATDGGPGSGSAYVIANGEFVAPVLVNLDAYAGQDIYVGILNDSTDDFNLYIDRVAVQEPVAYEALYAPLGNTLYNYAVVPANQLDLSSFFGGTVTNNGIEEITGGFIQYSILYQDDDAGEFVEESITTSEIANIAPGDSYTFGGDEYELTTEGFYIIYADFFHDDIDSELNVENNASALEYILISPNEYSSYPYFLDPDTDEDLTFYSGFNGTATESDYATGGIITIYEAAVVDSVSAILSSTEDGGVLEGDQFVEIYQYGDSLDVLLGTSQIVTGDGVSDAAVVRFDFACPVELAPGDYAIVVRKPAGATGQVGFAETPSYGSGALQFSQTDFGPLNSLQYAPAIFTFLSAEAGAPSQVSAGVTSSSFSIVATGASDGAICDWAWDFGDGNTGSGAVVQYVYAAAGEYTVTVTGTDPDGTTFTDTTVVTIGCAFTATAGDVTAGTASASVANGTAPITYAWTDAAGTVVSTDADATGLAESTTYTLTATDASGCSDSFEITTTSCALSSVGGPLVTGTSAGFTSGENIVVGGVAPYSYNWLDDSGNPLPNNGGNFISGITPGTTEYSVVVTDAIGCSISFDFGGGDPDAVQSIEGVNSFAIFPTLAQTEVNFNLSLNELSNINYTIYNVTGQVMVTKTFNSNNVAEQINVANFANGAYFVEFNINGKVATERFVVSH